MQVVEYRSTRVLVDAFLGVLGSGVVSVNSIYRGETIPLCISILHRQGLGALHWSHWEFITCNRRFRYQYMNPFLPLPAYNTLDQHHTNSFNSVPQSRCTIMRLGSNLHTACPPSASYSSDPDRPAHILQPHPSIEHLSLLQHFDHAFIPHLPDGLSHGVH